MEIQKNKMKKQISNKKSKNTKNGVAEADRPTGADRPTPFFDFLLEICFFSF